MKDLSGQGLQMKQHHNSCACKTIIIATYCGFHFSVGDIDDRGGERGVVFFMRFFSMFLKS